MELIVTRIDKTLPIPEYQTPGAVAFDVYARETITVAPKAVALVPSNLIVCVPPGYALLLSSRSSTAKKKGLIVPLGILDQDFCGPEDEMRIQVWNFTDTDVVIERGERVAQSLIVPIERCAIVEREPQATESRGGFGTTG